MVGSLQLMYTREARGDFKVDFHIGEYCFNVKDCEIQNVRENV